MCARLGRKGERYSYGKLKADNVLHDFNTYGKINADNISAICQASHSHMGLQRLFTRILKKLKSVA
jgi:hypothetical protein